MFTNHLWKIDGISIHGFSYGRQTNASFGLQFGIAHFKSMMCTLSGSNVKWFILNLLSSQFGLVWFLLMPARSIWRCLRSGLRMQILWLKIAHYSCVYDSHCVFSWLMASLIRFLFKFTWCLWLCCYQVSLAKELPNLDETSSINNQ